MPCKLAEMSRLREIRPFPQPVGCAQGRCTGVKIWSHGQVKGLGIGHHHAHPHSYHDYLTPPGMKTMTSQGLDAIKTVRKSARVAMAPKQRARQQNRVARLSTRISKHACINVNNKSQKLLESGTYSLLKFWQPYVCLTFTAKPATERHLRKFTS